MFVTLTALFSTLAHTILVLSALLIVEPTLFNFTFGAPSVELIYGIMVTNGLLEAVVAVLVVTPIVRAIHLSQGAFA
jgi:uncharacterized membrane protein